MELSNLTYQGPPITDETLLKRLPPELRGLLEQINGFIQFGGGLHIRGVCQAPEWHSLEAVWSGSLALSRAYAALTADDIPFGQDVLGDQFILRDGIVHRLEGETGEVSSLDCGFYEFLNQAQDDPLEYLNLYPLAEFQEDGGEVLPGQLLSAYPPYCTEQAGSGVSLKAVPAIERLKFLADFAAQIRGLEDGTGIEVDISD